MGARTTSRTSGGLALRSCSVLFLGFRGFGESSDYCAQRFQGVSVEVPQQTNTTDCGVYVLESARPPLRELHFAGILDGSWRILGSWNTSAATRQLDSKLQELVVAVRRLPRSSARPRGPFGSAGGAWESGS